MNTEQILARWLALLPPLPAIAPGKCPLTGFFMGCLGPVGCGIYLETWSDSFVPALLYLVFCALCGSPGWLAMCLFFGAWCSLRVEFGTASVA